MTTISSLTALASRARGSASNGFSHARLMEYSEEYLALSAQSGNSEESRISSRLLQDVPVYRHWEQEHERLMRGVASQRHLPLQSLEVKKVAFLTLHRKAPFEYLRHRQVTGQSRRQLVRALFGTQLYTRCILREHMAYLSSACSYFCSSSLCGDLMRETAFCEAISHYEASYSEYYRAYCDSLLAEQTGESSPLQPLLPYLRYQLKIIREHMLSGAPPQSDFMQLQALYSKLGDTQRLPAVR